MTRGGDVGSSAHSSFPARKVLAVLVAGALAWSYVVVESHGPQAAGDVTWVATQGPLPANARASGSGATPGSISCFSATTCVGAWTYLDSSTHFQGFLSTLSGGTWSAVEAPLPVTANASPAVTLPAVSCPSAAACVAVGSYKDTASATDGLLLNGFASSWTAAIAPTPPSAVNPAVSLSAVSCPAAGTCVAVGQYTDGSAHGQGLIETLSGGTWSAIPAPLGGLSTATNPAATLTSLACPSTTVCVAAGSYSDSSVHTQGLIEALSGGVWTATSAPLAGITTATNPAVSLTSAACPTTTKCGVVGVYNDGSNDTQGLIEALSGGVWTGTEAPLPAGAVGGNGTFSGVDLVDLACGGGGSCAITGWYHDAGGQEGLFDTLASGTWTPTEAPLPAGAATASQRASVTTLSCPAAGTCFAYGGYKDNSSNSDGALFSLSGGTWTDPEAPLPANASGGFTSPTGYMSCTDATDCTVLSSYEDTTPVTQPLVEQMGGGGTTATTSSGGGGPVPPLSPPTTETTTPTTEIQETTSTTSISEQESTTTTTQPEADVGVTIAGAPKNGVTIQNVAGATTSFFWTITVTNGGPDTAFGVTAIGESAWTFGREGAVGSGFSTMDSDKAFRKDGIFSVKIHGCPDPIPSGEAGLPTPKCLIGDMKPGAQFTFEYEVTLTARHNFAWSIFVSDVNGLFGYAIAGDSGPHDPNARNNHAMSTTIRATVHSPRQVVGSGPVH